MPLFPIASLEELTGDGLNELAYQLEREKERRQEQITCPRCNGDGEEPGAPVSTEGKATCDLCDGQGTASRSLVEDYQGGALWA